MRRQLIKFHRFIELIKQTADLFRIDTTNKELLECIKENIRIANQAIFGCNVLPCALIENIDLTNASFHIIQNQIDTWVTYIQKELLIRENITTKTDYDFYVFMEHIKHTSKNDLIQESIQCLTAFRNMNPSVYHLIIQCYNEYSYFWGNIDLDKGDVELIEDRITQLKEHWNDFWWLYRELEDYRSKKVLYGILRCWITFEIEEKNSIRENNFSDYYDFDLLQCNNQEVVVDLGAYTGDSALSYIENYGNYKRIYCYDISPASITQMKKNLDGFPNIIYRNYGVGKEKNIMYISEPNNIQSSSRLNSQNGLAIEIVTLDDDIQENITLIKMDIEGSELDALEGAKQHIQTEHPKLAICTYHNNHHIWEIPKKIKEYYPNYKLYMRYNGPISVALISEYVVFAIPS